MKRSKTYVAIPPGETLKELLEDRNMSNEEFSRRSTLSELVVAGILDGSTDLTYDIARKIELAIGIDAFFWLRLENLYRDKILLVDAENKMDYDIQMINNSTKNLLYQTT